MMKLVVTFCIFMNTPEENKTPVFHSLNYHIHIIATYKQNNEM
jgi:hypothetical protein